MKKLLGISDLNKGGNIELNVKKKKEIEHVLIGKLKPQNGHRVWEFNELTLEVKEAKYKSNTAFINGTVREKLIVNPNCIYIPALNMPNAKRKYARNKDQAFYYAPNAEMKL